MRAKKAVFLHYITIFLSVVTYPVAWSTTIPPEVAKKATDKTHADQTAIKAMYIQNACSIKNGIFDTTGTRFEHDHFSLKFKTLSILKSSIIQFV